VSKPQQSLPRLSLTPIGLPLPARLFPQDILLPEAPLKSPTSTIELAPTSVAGTWPPRSRSGKRNKEGAERGPRDLIRLRTSHPWRRRLISLLGSQQGDWAAPQAPPCDLKPVHFNNSYVLAATLLSTGGRHPTAVWFERHAGQAYWRGLLGTQKERVGAEAGLEPRGHWALDALCSW